MFQIYFYIVKFHGCNFSLPCIFVASGMFQNLIDQNQIVKLVEEAHHQREEFFAKVLYAKKLLCAVNFIRCLT